MLRAHVDFTKKVEKFDTDPEKWKQLVEKSNYNDRIRDSLASLARHGVMTGVHLTPFNDDAWKVTHYPVTLDSCKVPGFWGYVWLRKHFEFSRGTGLTDLKIQLPVNGKSYEIYINGNPVDETEDPATKAKVYKIRAEQLNRPENVLAIRLLVYYGVGYVGLKDVEPLLSSADGKVKISLGGAWKYSTTVEPELPQRQDYFNKINVLFNGMVAPVIPYGIRGVIWYQGEANVPNPAQYRSLFSMMIADWRIRWQEGYFPFLFVQLANYHDKSDEPVFDDRAELRESQATVLKLPNTGMAVAIDVGEAHDIHPKNKMAVGNRLYQAARKVAYGENNLYSGPIFDSLSIEGQKLRIFYSCTGSGLMTNNGKPPVSFAVAGTDEKFYWAEATIEGNQVVVTSPKVKNPVAVRYGWESNPEVNLYNREGLPAVPFRSDHWPRWGKK